MSERVGGQLLVGVLSEALKNNLRRENRGYGRFPAAVAVSDALELSSPGRLI